MAVIGKAKHRILDELRAGKSHGYKLATTLDMPITGIYQHLKELERATLVAAVDDGRRKTYSLTPLGRKLVDALPPP